VSEHRFDGARIAQLLASLEQLAAGDLEHTAPVSEAHDELDAIAFGINVLVDELRFAGAHLRHAKEEAESANRAKTVFLRNVSHDLRTPLTAIVGLAQLLAEPILDDARRVDLVARVHSNARALVGLVDDLLDLAKVEAGRICFELHPASPLDAIESVVHDLELQASKKGLQLVVERGDGVPLEIATDERRLRQILTNVIGNAIEFTRAGRITVSLKRLDALLLAVDVRDTGMGIDPAQQGELFRLFHTAHPALSSEHGGSGLGLMLSRRLAQGLGGNLALLESTPGVGSTFRLILPIDVDGKQRDETAPSRPSSLPHRPLAGLRILLAEDQPDIRLAIAELLAFAGAITVQVEDGNAAVARILEEAFDAVLMDVRMPGTDGLAATRLLRQRGSRVPIIALTADAVKEHRAECLDAGYDDYVAKPIDYAQLVEVLLRNHG